MLRGWVGPSRYLSEAKQRAALEAAGVEPRVIYAGAELWPALVKSLRPEAKDQAAVADLRVFGSRRALVQAAEDVAARGATLVVVESGAELHMPTLREVDRTLTRWRGESAIKSGKRAREMGKRGAAARRKQIAEERQDAETVGARWRDRKRYPNAADALVGTGWTRTTAWRHFGPREVVKPKRRKN
jgi:hypothetical protein